MLVDFKKPGEFTSFLLLVILELSSLTSLVWEIVNVITFSTSLITIPEYIGIAATGLCSIFYIKKMQNPFLVLLGTILIAGNFELIPFFHFNLSYHIQIQMQSLSFPIYLYWGNLYYTIMLIAFIIPNRKAIQNSLKWVYRHLPGE